MKQIVGLATAVAVHSAAPLAAQRAPTEPSYAIVHATVVDADGYRPDQTVIITGDRLTEVGTGRTVTVPPRLRVIDARGQFLIPGLWDMHVHTTALGSERLAIFVVNGVTGVRDLGGVPDSVFLWAQEIARRARLGPRIVAAGLTLTGPGGTAPHIAVVTTADEARKAVQANLARGASVVKVWSTIPRDAYLGATAEARRAGVPLVGHLPVAVSLKEALDAGQRGFEHLIGVPIALTKDEAARLGRLRAAVAAAPNVGGQLAAMLSADSQAVGGWDSTTAAAALSGIADVGAWVCPTLTDSRAYTIMRDSLPDDERLQYLPAPMRAAWIAEATAMKPAEIASWKLLFANSLKLTGALKRAGVRLLAGTDAGSTYDVPGFDLHTELALLVKAGLTPLEALTAATRSGAEVAGFRDRAGLVKAGQFADLVLLDGNPLADIGNTRRIAAVAVAGRWLDRPELAALRRRLADLR